MDMQKIGTFLAELRKEKNLTQDELGEQIGVTNKTVSRWENGNYLPPVEFLQILSKLYDVSLNELLSGERLNEACYKQNAEEYITTDLMTKSKDAKKRMIVSYLIATLTVVSGVAEILMGALFTAPVWWRVLCFVWAAVTVILGIGICCVLIVDAGVYECPECGEKFVPTMRAFVFGLHTFTKRNLKCPKCGKKSYCKKKLN